MGDTGYDEKALENWETKLRASGMRIVLSTVSAPGRVTVRAIDPTGVERDFQAEYEVTLDEAGRLASIETYDV